eukprot:1169627-Rhodomonas_salina.1
MCVPLSVFLWGEYDAMVSSYGSSYGVGNTLSCGTAGWCAVFAATVYVIRCYCMLLRRLWYSGAVYDATVYVVCAPYCMMLRRTLIPWAIPDRAYDLLAKRVLRPPPRVLLTCPACPVT